MQYQNRYSIGKQFRKSKGLRHPDPTAKTYQPHSLLHQYIHYLKTQGLHVQGLQLANFYTKNGLPYPGLMCTRTILSNEIFIKVPKCLLLNTKIAYFSDLQHVFDQNKEIFHQDFYGDWEDKILLVFLLYEHQKGTKSPWYLLIQNLPKEIDYLCYWHEKELVQLEDNMLMKQAIRSLKQFNDNYQLINKVLKKYPSLFKQEFVNYDLCKWIQIHLNSRCFGKYFSHVTMVPFAELLNHQCSDVYYDFQYLSNNPHHKPSSFQPPKKLTPEEIEDQQSSDGSYFSDGQDDDPFEQPLPERNLEGPKLYKDILFHIQNFLDYNDSLSYRMADRILIATEKATEKQLESLYSQLKQYISDLKMFFKNVKGSKFKYLPIQKKVTKEEAHLDPSKCKFIFENDTFDNFVMKCSSKDQFEKGAQMFYCYGRLSNRALLQRYGFAMEYNKYHHYWYYYSFIEQVKSIWLSTEIRRSKASRTKRIKIKRNVFCEELLIWVRIKHCPIQQTWQVFNVLHVDKEKACAIECQALLQKEISQKFKHSLQYYEGRLSDSSRNYHQHFADIYVLQNLRGLIKQIELFRTVERVCERMGSREEWEKTLNEWEGESSWKVNRCMLQKYLKKLLKHIKP